MNSKRPFPIWKSRFINCFTYTLIYPVSTVTGTPENILNAGEFTLSFNAVFYL